MSSESQFDLVVKNARVVQPNQNSVEQVDLGIKDGRFALLAPEIPAESASDIYDAKNLLAFPGVVDAHMHVGIYSPLAEDAFSESRAAAMGGVTASLNYMRTGQYYLNRSGAIQRIFPRGAQTLRWPIPRRL